MDAQTIQKAIENFLRKHQDQDSLNEILGSKIAPGKVFNGKFVPYDGASAIVEQTDDNGENFSAVLTIQLDFTVEEED